MVARGEACRKANCGGEIQQSPSPGARSPRATRISTSPVSDGNVAAMCNLYRMTKATAEVAHLFGAQLGSTGNFATEVFPGYPGLVVAPQAGSASPRSLELRSMVWGFPLVLKGKNGQPLKPQPVNNARADKLDGFMWRYSFQERRCLIPVSAFAEAEGEKGAKTRTWFTLPGEEVFAVAGLWRDTPEWGLAYTMVMTEACQHVAGVHDRMPVILRRADLGDWLDGPPDAAGLLCRPYPELMAVERTGESWVRRA
jgi:putative SOS response-associated peptidase YedK